MTGLSHLRESRLDERGVTLVEVVVVGILASIVMLALTGFYISSQGAWIDASSQAVTQRDVTFAIQMMSDSVHASYSADASTPHTLILYEPRPGTFVPPAAPTVFDEKCRFWLNASDSLLHEGEGTTIDRGPVANSKVTRFDVSTVTAANGGTVKILALEMRSANGRVVQMSTNAVFYNR